MKFLPRTLLILTGCLVLALPQLAEARAGGGKSSGSMGSHTYTAPSYNAQPIQRSVTPYPSSPTSNTMPPSGQPGYSQPMMQPASHPFLYGIAGGFLGSSIASMLFGHSYGYGGMGMDGNSQMGSGFGGLLQLLVLGGLGYMVFRWLTGRSRNGGFTGFGSIGGGLPNISQDASFSSGTLLSPPPSAERPLALAQSDFQAFPVLLEKIQLAWGESNLNHLRPLLTPEMMQYFSEELAANTSRGLANIVNTVTVVGCAPLQSWSEADLDYATLRMKWRAIDYMVRMNRMLNDQEYVESGDATKAVEAEEIWTFTRAHDGGNWLLSAIQQID